MLDKRAGGRPGALRGSSVCLSLGVSVLGTGPEGPCHCQPPLDCPGGLEGDLLCVLFVIFCLQLEAILQRVIVLFVSDSPSRASSVVRQALLVCVGTCGGRPSRPRVPLPSASAAQRCAWTKGSWGNGRPWPRRLPKCCSADRAGFFSPNRLAGWSLGKGRGGPCQLGADEPELPWELRGQQRSSSPGRLQLTTQCCHQTHHTMKSQLWEVKLRPSSRSPVRAEPLQWLCPSLALYPEKGHIPAGSNFWGRKGAP